MNTKFRLIAGAALLMLAAAGCDRSPVQPQTPAVNLPVRMDLETDSVETGYFGSGHYTPPDSVAGEPPS